ncbi:MAG: Type II secretion system protein F [Firmicutes bacterium]|nr:Type II secretion system protein F [Bacillota bacterium]
MPRFSYIAKDTSGGNFHEVVDMASVGEVISSLRRRGLIPLSITPVSARTIFKERKGEQKGGRLRAGDIAAFFRQLSTMLGAGVSLADAVDDLSEGVGNIALQRILQEVKKDISRGDSFSRALSKHQKVFSFLTTSMVNAGEESGNLDGVLADLSTYLENEMALRRKIKSATSYPIFIGFFFLGATAFVTFFLLPRFRAIFAEMGVDLPLFTRIVLGISSFLVSNIIWGCGIVVLIIIFFVVYSRTSAGHYNLDYLKLKIPFVGKFLQQVALGRFSQTLSTLQRGGIPILTSLEIAGHTSGNLFLTRAIEAVHRGLVKGGMVSEGLAKNVIFPRMMVRMVMVGEETGKMEEMLDRVHKAYQDEVESAITSMSAIIEPLLIVILGAIVGVTVLAIYLPIFRIAGAVK